MLDWRILQVHQPELRVLDVIAEEGRSRLEALYEEYVQNVSPSYMAISLELASVLTALCIIFRPGSILDLGSGFSSVVFREYSRATRRKPLILSVDDSEDWLRHSRQFLALHGLSTENLITWEHFEQDHSQRFDLVLHDLGSMDVRGETLVRAIASTQPDGILVLDDVHKQSYASYVTQTVNKIGAQCYSLRSITRDSISRYAMLVKLPRSNPARIAFAQAGKINALPIWRREDNDPVCAEQEGT